MPLIWRCLPAIVAIFLLSPNSSEGQTARGGITLVEARKLALEHNSDLKSAWAQVEIAKAQLREAKEWTNPTLGVSVGHINTDHRGNYAGLGNGLFDRSYDSVVALSQLIELGGKMGLRAESASAGQKSAEAQLEDTRRLLLAAVSQSYVSALQSRETVRILKDSAKSLRREAEIAAHRFAQGDISRSDQAQIELTATQRELDAVAAENATTAAIIALESLMGSEHPNGDTVLLDHLDDLAQRELVVPEAIPAGLRPDVVAAEAGLEKAEEDLTGEKRKVVPDLTVSLQFEHNPPDMPNSVGVGVSLPLPVWNMNEGGIHMARAARDQAKAQFEKAEIRFRAEVAAARSALREAKHRLDVSTNLLRPRSEEILKSIGYSYEKGGSSLLELLSAERADNDIQLAAIQAEADCVNAQYALAAAVYSAR